MFKPILGAKNVHVFLKSENFGKAILFSELVEVFKCWKIGCRYFSESLKNKYNIESLVECQLSPSNQNNKYSEIFG